MKPRAYTLLETLIASALIGICLTGIWSLVRAGSRYLSVTNAKTKIQNDALRTLRLIGDQFAQTNPNSFSVGNSTVVPANGQTNHGVVFVSPRDPDTGEIEHDAKGRLLWCKYVAFYQREETPGSFSVVRSVSNLPTKWPYPPPSPTLDAFVATLPEVRTLARNAALFEVDADPSDIVIRLRCELPSGFGRKYGFEVKTLVYCRN